MRWIKECSSQRNGRCLGPDMGARLVSCRNGKGERGWREVIEARGRRQILQRAWLGTNWEEWSWWEVV